MEKLSQGSRHCEDCRAWGFSECPYDTVTECDKACGRIKNPHNIKCGYPLCPYYNPEVKILDCPMPIEGAPCQGMGNPYEHHYGTNKEID